MNRPHLSRVRSLLVTFGTISDESLLDRAIHPRVFKYGFYRPREAEEYGAGEEMTREAMREFAADVRARGREPDPRWPKEVEILDLMDQMAVVKVHAWWGADYLSMGRADGRWQIFQVLWQSYPPQG